MRMRRNCRAAKNAHARKTSTYSTMCSSSVSITACHDSVHVPCIAAACRGSYLRGGSCRGASAHHPPAPRLSLSPHRREPIFVDPFFYFLSVFLSHLFFVWGWPWNPNGAIWISRERRKGEKLHWTMAAGQVRGADAVHSPLSNKRILICHQTTLNRCARKQEKGSRDRDSPGAGAVVAQTLVLTPGCAGCRWQYKRPSSVPSLGCRARAQCRTTPRTASRAPCRSTVSVLRGVLRGLGVGGGGGLLCLCAAARHAAPASLTAGMVSCRLATTDALAHMAPIQVQPSSTARAQAHAYGAHRRLAAMHADRHGCARA